MADRRSSEHDIVGGDTIAGDTMQDKQRIRVVAQDILSTSLIEQIRQALSIGGENETQSRQVLDVDRTYFTTSRQPFHAVMELRLDRFLRSGDHKSFSDKGFPAVRYTSDAKTSIININMFAPKTERSMETYSNLMISTISRRLQRLNDYRLKAGRVRVWGE